MVLHFKDEETEVQRGSSVSPDSLSWSMVEPGYESRTIGARARTPKHCLMIHPAASSLFLPPRSGISYHTSSGSYFQSPGLCVSHRQSAAAAKNLVKRTSWYWLVPLISTFFGSFTLHWILQGTELMMGDQKDIKE